MLYETEHYELVIGKDDKDQAIYQVVNRATKVIEYDDYILPRSLDAMSNLEEKLVDADKVFRQAVAADTLSLVVVGDENDKGSLH